MRSFKLDKLTSQFNYIGGTVLQLRRAERLPGRFLEAQRRSAFIKGYGVLCLKLGHLGGVPLRGISSYMLQQCTPYPDYPRIWFNATLHCVLALILNTLQDFWQLLRNQMKSISWALWRPWRWYLRFSNGHNFNVCTYNAGLGQCRDYRAQHYLALLFPELEPYPWGGQMNYGNVPVPVKRTPTPPKNNAIQCVATFPEVKWKRLCSLMLQFIVTKSTVRMNIGHTWKFIYPIAVGSFNYEDRRLENSIVHI